MITCHFEISDFVHHLGGKTQKSLECCFLIENGSRFELKVSFLDIYMMNFSLHDFLNIRKGCFKHLSGFYFIITSHCYSDCEYMVGILWWGDWGTVKIILASQADETDHKENKKDFLSFCIETFWTSKICVQTSNYPTQF